MLSISQPDLSFLSVWEIPKVLFDKWWENMKVSLSTLNDCCQFVVL